MPPAACDAPDLTGLIELSRDPLLDLKPIVLRVQTDLFLTAPVRDRATLEAFESLATGLIPTVDFETALTVAGKLGPCADTPESVLVRLVARGGAIGQTVLDTAPRLTARIVAAARAAGFSVEGWVASPSATETHPMDHTAVSKASASEIVDRSEEELPDARIELSRIDIAPADLAPFWLQAAEPQRGAIRDAVAATAALRPCPPAPRNLGSVLTERATQRDVAGFVGALSESLGLAPSFLAAAPDATTRYDLLTLAMRAADLSEADTVYIFLTLNETVARSVERVFELAKLYRTTNRATARDLLSAILGVALPERVAPGIHQPYLAPDAARPRLSASTERALERAVTTHRLKRSAS